MVAFLPASRRRYGVFCSCHARIVAQASSRASGSVHIALGVVALILLALLLFAGEGFGQELILNGAFEDSLRYWSVGYENAQGQWSVACSTHFHPDSDSEVRVYKLNGYYVTAYQTVVIPTTNLRFSALAKLEAGIVVDESAFAYATVMLEYLDARDTVLGRTMIVKKSTLCTLANSATQHLINVTSNDWEQYQFLVSTELGNLPGIDPSQIDKIRVGLKSFGNGLNC